MFKKITIFICIFGYAICSFSQTENNKDSIVINKEHPLHDFKELRPIEQNPESKIASENKVSPEELKRRQIFLQSLDFLAQLPYIGPKPDPTSGESLGRILPQTYDYSFFDSYSAGDDLSLSTESYRESQLGLGSTQLVSFNLNYQVTDWLSMTSGIYGSKSDMPAVANGMLDRATFNSLGINTSFRLKLHEKIYLRAYGQYSIYSGNLRGRNINPMSSIMNIYPGTYYGGGVEYKINKNFGVEGGMMRELNPFTGKWQNRPYIMPVIYSVGGR